MKNPELVGNKAVKHWTLKNKHLSPAKLTIVDGFPGGGKSLVSSLTSHLRHYGMWTPFYPLETISYCQKLGLIDFDGAKMILLKELDCVTRDQLFSRRINMNLRDLSSIKNYRGWIDPVRRFFRNSQDLKLHDLDESSYYTYGHDFSFYTHLNTQNLNFCFETFENKINYIWIVPNFFSLNFFSQLSNWIQRWEIGDATVFYLEKPDNPKKFYPCILSCEYIEDFINASHIGKAIILTRSILEETLSEIDLLFEKFDTPNFRLYKFESLVANPYPYLTSIENLTGSIFYKSVHKEMRKQNIPRERSSFEIDLIDTRLTLVRSLLKADGLTSKMHFEAICDRYNSISEYL